MRRRDVLTGGLGAVPASLFAGCFDGGPYGGDGPDGNGSSGPGAGRSTTDDCSGTRPVAVEKPVQSGRASGFALSLETAPATVGDEMALSLVNETDEQALSGNRYKYAIQRGTGDGWRSVVHIPDRAVWTNEGVRHDPGEGFEWSLELSASGLERDVETHPDFHVCEELDAGTYRFVYFGLDPAAVAVEFEVA